MPRQPSAQSSQPGPLWASAVCAGVYDAGCRDVVYVPDNPLSHILRGFETGYPDVRVILATREEEAFGIAAGLYLGGRRPALLFQSSGLGNSLNAVTSLFVPYQIPALMIVSWRGDDGEWNAAQRPMGQAIRSILDAVGIAHSTITSPDAAHEIVRLAGDAAFRAGSMAACLLPRAMTSAS